jgi:hypothetical protein
MTIKLPFLSEDEIEKEAKLLLAEYTETSGTITGRASAERQESVTH